MKKFRSLFIITLVVVFTLTALPSIDAMSAYIPGAHNVNVVRYDDLTTINPAIGNLAEARRAALAPNDYSGDGKPKRFAWYSPKFQVPGLEISGMFEDAKFVIRIPDNWNGKLVVAGAPGIGDERSTDAIIADYVLTKLDINGNSYAYACSDKGTTGETIPAPDGKLHAWSKAMTALVHEKDTVEEWNMRLRQLTVATKDLLKRTRGQEPARTYLVGMSNGGYVTRYAIENDGALYDGMIDWEGILWRPNEANVISSMADSVKAWRVITDPKATAGEKEAAYGVFEAFGPGPEAKFLIPFHATFYYLPTLNQFRVKLDPEWKHRDWWEFLTNAEDYEGYNFFTRDKAKARIAKFQNTGDIKKPVITVHGTWDALLFANVHARPYEELVKKAGKSSLYRLYMVERGNHFDSLVGNPSVDKNKLLQPLLPYVHQAFDILVDWVENGVPAPPSQTIGVPSSPENAIDIRTGGETPKY